MNAATLDAPASRSAGPTLRAPDVGPRREPPAGNPAASAGTTAHVRSEDFSVFYGSHEAVRKVSLAVPDGKVTAIIGPSGCGKSTYLRAINRMNDLIPRCRPGGRMLFDGVDIYGPRVDVVTLRRRVGMVFQKPNPFPKTVFDNVAYGPRLHGTTGRGELTELVERSLVRGCAWRAFWPWTRRWCLWTSRPPLSIPAPRPGSKT